MSRADAERIELVRQLADHGEHLTVDQLLAAIQFAAEMRAAGDQR